MARRSISRILVCSVCFLAALAIASPSASAQRFLYDWIGPSPDSGFGFTVSDAGDVDGDGVVDIIVGAHRRDNASGSVYIYSGLTGARLKRYDGENDFDLGGAAVAPAGDVDGDGFDDVIVGAPGYPLGLQNGAAYVISPHKDAVLWKWVGATTDSCLGFSVGGLGDINGDGHADVIVGAPDCVIIGTGQAEGEAFIYSGNDGSVLWSGRGPSLGATYGSAVAGIGDIDADGIQDFAVGACLVDLVYVYSSRNGLIRTLAGDTSGDVFGWKISGGGDVDADGIPDFAVGAPGYGSPCDRPGKAHVFSGRDLSEIAKWEGESDCDQFGNRVSCRGDVTGDGHGDVLVGAPEWPGFGAGGGPGKAYLYSGRSGRLIQWGVGEDSDGLGFGLEILPDIDGDGFCDMAAGSPGIAGDSWEGEVSIVAGNDLLLFQHGADFLFAGSLFDLTIGGGEIGAPFALFLTKVNGVPYFGGPLLVSVFVAEEYFKLAGVVPPGLGTIDLTFSAFAIGFTGKIIDSDSVDLLLR